MRIVEGRGHLLGHFEDKVVGQGLARAQHLLEVGPLHILHGDEGLFAIGCVVHGDDAGMVEAAGGARLAKKRRRVAVGAFVEMAVQRLDRHQAAEGRVLCQIDDAHGAPPQLFDDFVTAQAFGGHHGSAPRSSVGSAAPAGYGAIHLAAGPAARRAGR